MQSEQISNDSYENQEDTFIYVDHSTTSSQQTNEVFNDLADNIDGLYRLLDLCNDDSSNGTVDKIIISKEHLRRLCNNMVPSSFKSISEINYKELNSISFRLIGCYGNCNLIAKFLLSRDIINKQTYDLLTASASIEPSLRPGIYLLMVNPNFGLIIHWPEIGCYYVNSLNTSSPTKRNMVNLHRYLTKLTDRQMCFMSDKDLENFDFNLESSDANTDDDDDSDDDYEVKECQDEQDFKINNGFKVKLSNEIKAEINNQIEDDIPLYPIVVESTTNQSFVTRQLIKINNSFVETPSYVSKGDLPTDLKTKSQGYYLRIDRNMHIKALKIFIKYGIKKENLLNSLDEVKKRNKQKKDQARKDIDEDIEIIKQMASIKLCDFESIFGKYTAQDNSNCSSQTRSQTSIPDDDLKRIQKKYPGMENQIDGMIKIDSKCWKKLKKKFNLTCVVIENISETEENSNEKINTFYNMFTDDETKSKKLFEKYIQQIQPKLNRHSKLCDTGIKKAKKITNDKLDVDFIQELVNFELFDGQDDIKKEIINTFMEEYQKWKKEKFSEILDKQLDDLKRECKKEKNIIFEKICNEIETEYKNGSLQLTVLNVKEHKYDIEVMYNTEVLHHQLQITIYETSLKEEDKFKIQENELHIPCPILLPIMNQYGVAFRIDLQKYDFKKIFQFDSRNNRNFLLVLYNKKDGKIEIFFDTAQRLEKNFKSNSINPFKTLNTNEDFLIAVNEPKGLLAIYNTKEAKLNVFSFDDNRKMLYTRNANIQLSQWYNNNMPNIKYFLFIKDTEDLCFVENSGRARIFNLVNLQFRPAACNFPHNLVNVLSSPDGSCIMAFAKEVPENREINRVYVYFFKSFGGSPSKEIDLPSNFKSLEFLQISYIDRQTHLVSLDLQNGCFNSLLVKITIEKTQFLFQKSKQKQPLALQRTKSNDLINAYKLMFEKYSIDNCIDPKQNCPLSLKIVLDINNDDHEECDEKFEKYIKEMFENLENFTKKPASILKKFSTSTTTFQKLDIGNSNFQKKFSSEYQLGKWIIQLCCLIPIQIAVTRKNMFLPLKDGLSTNEDYLIDLEDGHHVDIIAKNISFGWYEGIFKHFSYKKVKVVSSMGEQSCGKSFMLNHLIGTTFDESAMRCTEGVWMSLVNTQEYIYVALDFEGLRSLERTPQEDMFLTLFNTVVSNLILFKNQFAINRDVSTMFQKFQDGAKLFESDPKMFQARLCIIIKDVPRGDKDGIKKEFQLKLSQLVKEEGEDNFISRMYRGGLNIIPWPVFNDIAWFKQLSQIKKRLDEQETKYENARAFLHNTKVIMAKLMICDWGSLSEDLIQIRVAMLKRLLPFTISYGIERNDPFIEHLVNHDSGELIYDPIINLCDVLKDFKNSTEIFSDSGILLYDERTSFERLSEDLRRYFENTVQPRRESHDDNEWFSNLSKFFEYVIKRRKSRVQYWYEQNTAKFPQDNSDIASGKYVMKQEISKLALLWTLCGLRCHQCGLKCVKNRDHKENHECLTDHKCYFPCHFTKAHNDDYIPECSHKAGHEGKHVCDEINHSCGKPCNLIDKRNCQKVCFKEIGHDDGEHLCQSRNHYCGEDCSLSTHTHTTKGDYHCPNKCIKPYEEEHHLHRCENTTCPIQCPIPDCKEKCQSNDHFHAFSDLQVNHFCGNEHQCRELCEDDGICQVDTKPKEKKETYKGLINETSITFTKYIQLSKRLECNKKIPPNEFEHTGKHTHNENGFHYCDSKCQFCEYYCTSPYGHAQDHDTKHGNMTQTEFTGEDNEFEYAGYKLRAGDQGIFVLCNLFCKDLGRHRHIDYCHNEENCKFENQNIQHIHEKVSPNPDKPKDFVSHKLYWERTGFKDPYTAQDQQEFTKCDHECPDEKHHKPELTKSFCELQLFHAPLDLRSKPPKNCGYVSLDGHQFNCENPSTAFHIIFVIDRSKSMKNNDKKPISDHPIYNDLKKKHNNRIGAVYQAVYYFMESRINSAKVKPNQVSFAMRDTVSLILFHKEVIIPFKNRDLTDTKDLLHIMLKHNVSKGTDFRLAIQEAGSLIDDYFEPKKENIIIFLSDGRCDTPSNELRDICERIKERGSPLYLYTVLFGNDSDGSSLKEMAEIAQSYHPAKVLPDALQCRYKHAIDEVNLIGHFNEVATSLRKHIPALLNKAQ
ncbi:hypothetical protein GLOIN_2v1781568 [Rhizophagus clarus]|uniref:VWFA domain-containing protein n=1 Tax=Rhizophagus clarus TaxID=94130 RepID=A0A8H3QDF1_9GLOM|nr:hypothetical protein GLOIN_2v1781568 [Rhizophagus clarus]